MGIEEIPKKDSYNKSVVTNPNLKGSNGGNTPIKLNFHFNEDELFREETLLDKIILQTKNPTNVGFDGLLNMFIH